MVELRDYQQDLLAQVQSALADPSARVMLQLPTGGGKTRIAAALLRWWLSGGGKAVWLTHRRELSEQTCLVLNKAGVPATNTQTWPTGESAPSRKGGVVVFMGDTVKRRNRSGSVWHNYNAKDLLLIDEAHHAPAAGWERAIKQWPGPVVGLTATPWRLSKTQRFDHLFDTLVQGPQIHELQYQNHLAKSRVLMPDDDSLILGGNEVSAGDYTQAGIERANQGRNIWTARAFRFWEEYAQDRQTIVYAVSKDHARNLAKLFNDADVTAEVLLGETPSNERSRNVRRFSSGDLQVLVNVDVATEGFDLPDADCVMLTRPTLSLALYLQMVGRGLRAKEGGGDCLILDLAGNVERHGFPEDEREWSLEPRGSKDATGLAPVVRCPNCAVVSPAASHYCSECGGPLGKECGWCGKWRAWKTWVAEDYCANNHDLVCDYCHIDSHNFGTIPEGLKAVLRKELNKEGSIVDPKSLRTLDAWRDEITVTAENLIQARKLDEVSSFDLSVNHLRNLLGQEKRLRTDAQNEAKVALQSELEPVFIPLFLRVREALLDTRYTGDMMLEIRANLKGDGEKANLLIDGKEMLEVLTHEQFIAVTDAIEEWQEGLNE